MAELDYALLADFARVEGGRLTVVGGSYTHLVVPQVPAQHLLSVAGRLRAPQEVAAIQLGIAYEGPGGDFRMDFQGEVTADSTSRPYNGTLGFLFAFTSLVPISTLGLHQVHLSIDGEPVRRLAFDVESAPS